MQTKKKEVRDCIYNAGLIEFKQDGYKGTTMRNISKRANVPIGNLYRYFKNKDVLFEDIVGKIYTKIVNIVSTPDPIEYLDKNMDLNIDLSLGKIININTEYRDELLILLNGSEGSKYDDFKKVINKKLSYRMKSEWQFFVDKDIVLERDLFIFDVIGVGIIEGFIMIFNQYDNREQLEYALKEYAYLIIGDIIKRLDLLKTKIK